VSVQPSSLIFLVIIAIWAAYFIQHWVRRREHLATARSVDRFSESMRVLEHRAALPGADLSAPQPRSYAVSPARPARAEILVKRADRSPVASEPVAATSSAASAARAASAAPATSAEPAAPAVSGRRARGLTLLGSLAALLVTTGLCAFAVVPWLAVAAPVAAIAAVLVWMRQGAKAEQAARRAARAASGRAAGDRQPHRQGQQVRATQAPARRERRAPQAAGVRSEVPAHRAQPQADDRDDADRGDADRGDADTTAQPSAATRESFYDVEAVERGGAQPVAAPAAQAPAAVAVAPAVPLVDEDDIPLTWDPVPVPRPTYTMKAAAPRTQAPPVAAGVPPELAEPAYEEPVRRVAGA
jgi:hypothetical protein